MEYRKDSFNLSDVQAALTDRGMDDDRIELDTVRGVWRLTVHGNLYRTYVAGDSTLTMVWTEGPGHHDARVELKNVPVSVIAATVAAMAQ